MANSLDYNKMNMYGQYTVPNSDVMINLGVGQPRNLILSKPVEIMKKYMKEYSSEILSVDVLQYGDIKGYYRFRYFLSEFLNKYNYKSKPEHFFQTNGATEAVSLITTLFSSNDDIIIVENPTYFLMINIFKEMNRNIIGINMDNNGFNIKELKKVLENYSKQKVLFYGIPFNHNPTGISWSEECKIELCQLLDKYKNFTVMTDEVYQLLNFDKTYYTPMSEYHNNIITIGSFSKVIAPALRIGWIYTKNDSYMNRLISSSSRDSSGGNNVLGSLLVEKMLINGDVDKLLDSEKSRLNNNISYIRDYMEKYTSKYFDYKMPKGGYFIWLKLKQKYNSFNICDSDIMNKFKVKYHNGYKFSINKDFSNYIRLSISFYTKEEIIKGLERLTNIMESFISKKYIKVVGIYGYKGRLGSLIVKECNNNNIKYNGLDELAISESYDCIIDVTSTDGTKKMLNTFLQLHIYPTLIIGTTGHNSDTIKLFKKYGKYGGIYYLSNFSSGVRMLKNFIKSNSNKFNDYKVSIDETHHIHKKDTPSGTAISLAECFDDNNIQIMSHRKEEVFGEHKITISNDYEVIEITHKALKRELFAKGCIKFINDIDFTKKGFYLF